MANTVGEVIDLVVSEMIGNPPEGTVDTLKVGDRTQPVTGIATTFLATSTVIRRAAEVGANLVITHEPIFYNHEDRTEFLLHDPVYRAKRDLLDRTGMSVWRLHDIIHMRRAGDGIIDGLVERLGWQEYRDRDRPYLCTLPPESLGTLIDHLKARLGVPRVRVVGDLSLICRGVALTVGAAGRDAHIRAFQEWGANVVLSGEIAEWETPEYVRDSIDAGMPRALVVLGHAASEEVGMEWLADRLRERFPDLNVSHIASGNPLKII